MLGKWQTLPVYSKTDFGVYLGDAQHKVLLPGKQVPEGTVPGDEIEVFLYRDSSDRLIATVHNPLITIGEVRPLKVKQITKIGAFLDWGLEKDLFLPFRQQTGKLEEGFWYPVALYVDKSDRLAATMWIDPYLPGADADEKKKAKSIIKLQADSENVYTILRRKGGRLEYNDKADPSRIESDFGMSKNAFKRAVGVLYKARRILISEDSIEILS
ncbi:MAG: RNA-binding protein [Parasporobacterium sp.]|nr:RNA-binding protein [Parasporobacterium sp.]